MHEIVDSLDDEAAAGEIVLNVEIEILELVLTKEAYRKAEFHRHGSGTNAAALGVEKVIPMPRRRECRVGASS